MTIQKSILDLSYIPIQISNSSNCPYIDSKIETRAFINLSDYPESHDQLAEIGFRRVENWAYKPICHDCNQCMGSVIINKTIYQSQDGWLYQTQIIHLYFKDNIQIYKFPSLY